MPGRQRDTSLGVHVALRRLHRGSWVSEDELVEGWPPHLVIGRGDDLPKHLPWDHAPDRRVQMWRESALRFNGGEVLDLVAGGPAQVLPQPVNELRKVHRVQRLPPIVVPARVHRGPIGRTRPYDGSVKVANIDGRNVGHPWLRTPSRWSATPRAQRQIRHILPPARRRIRRPTSTTPGSSRSFRSLPPIVGSRPRRGFLCRGASLRGTAASGADGSAVHTGGRRSRVDPHRIGTSCSGRWACRPACMIGRTQTPWRRDCADQSGIAARWLFSRVLLAGFTASARRWFGFAAARTSSRTGTDGRGPDPPRGPGASSVVPAQTPFLTDRKR